MINGFDCAARTADACRLCYNSGCLFVCLMLGGRVYCD